MDLEELVARLEGIAPARGFLWNVSELSSGRLFLTRSEENLPAIFLQGERETFGPLPQTDAIQHSSDIKVIPSGERLSALRITASDSTLGLRIIAHIGYEMAWRLAQEPQVENEELLANVRWLLSLFGEKPPPMGPERQRGLVGECLFLRLLLRRALEIGVRPLNALQCWAGADLAKRDFYANKTAVEAKATGHATRLHHITSLNQLSPQAPDETVYLFSVGIRQDPTAPRKITHFIGDIEALLVNRKGAEDVDAIVFFREQLKKAGFDWSDIAIYERDSGFLAPHLAPAIFREQELEALSLKHFVDGKLPETVRAISYELEVVGTPISSGEIEALCDRLLGV